MHGDGKESYPSIIGDKPFLDECPGWVGGYMNNAEHWRISIRANAAPSHSELKLLCVERAKRLAPTPAVRRCRLLQVFQWSAAADGVWVS